MFAFLARLWNRLFGKHLDEPPLPKPIPFTTKTIWAPHYLFGIGKRWDWPVPGYVGLEHEYVSPDFMTVKQKWTFRSGQGDGYQIATLGSDGWVRFKETVDGGTNGVQYFVGQTGWLVFGIDADSNWREVVARLNISVGNPNAQMRSNYALTRYKRDTIGFAFFLQSGYGQTLYLDTIISEHFDMKTAGESTSVERSYFGNGHGLIRWELWKRTPSSLPDLNQRDKNFELSFNVPPGGSWYLNDVRQYTVEDPKWM